MNVNLLLESPSPGISKPMTAGADPQPVESSTAPKMPSVTSIRHIPHILDHNYGQPPPMTPPDSNSPGPDDIDTGNEDEESDGVTRCICGFDHDDGYMICCDKCSVWQHIECMGITSDAVPESYLCDQCQPRTLDRVHARAIQERKREELSDDDDDDDEESEEDRDTPTYTAVSNTPTRITLTAKVTRKRKKGTSKVKEQNALLSDGHDKPKKPKRRRRQKQKPPATTFVPVDEDTSEPWDNNCSSFDQYEVVDENIYCHELEQLALNSIQENGIPPSLDGDEQRCKVVEVQRCTKGVVVTEDMDKNNFIIQCKGKMMLLSRFELENQFFKRCSPFVLYYSKLDHLQLCVDARTHGNDARFVRRSCSPNAEVKHYIHNGRVCLGIFSTCPLPRGAEVTIPFEFQLEEYHSSLDCACSQDMCAVTKYNMKYQNQSPEMPAQKRFKAGHEDDGNSSHHQKMSPLQVSLSNSHGLQGDSDSDLENNPENRRKKSREERKLEAYLKQIEKMEKKEKRKQQTQKEHKQDAISPTSQEVTVNKLGSRNLRGMKKTLNKRRSGMPGLKKRHGRLSSCSSEPLSPDDHSSTASTPTTPKVTSSSSLPDEPCYVTPSSSPNRNFKFPKGTKQCADEDVKETLIKEAVQTETGEHSGASAPGSPVTPREDTDVKPVLSTASSTADLTQDADAAPVCESTVCIPESASASVADSGHFGKDLGQSLADCLVEVNSAVASGRNTPSPCPSTSGSPTSAESVTSNYSGSAAERTSPGPAPGSPVASVKFGQRATRANPLYGSLKKRWLFQYLCEQKLVNNRPPNGFKVSVSSTISCPVNGKTVLSPVRRNGLAKIIDPLPLKKRHLKKFQTMSSEPAKLTTAVASECRGNEPCCDEPLIVSSPVALEQQVQIVLADSVNDLQPHKQETRLGTELLSLREGKLVRPHTTAALSSVDSNVLTANTQTAGNGVSTTSMTISLWRPSDPRLVNISPVSSTYPPILPPSSGVAPVVNVTSPVSASLPSQSVSLFPQGSDYSSGTPGKKKVSLLEYRNRSRHRLSVDTPRTAPPHPAAQAAVVPSAVFSSSSVIQSSSLSTSFPNLGLTSSPSSVHRPVASDVNGPHLEPVSPDVDDKSSGLVGRFGRMANSVHPHGRTNHVLKAEGGVVRYNEGDSRLKREIQKKHEMITKREESKARLTEKFTSIISEQLQKDNKSTPSSVVSRSPSTGAIDSSHPPLEPSGDAMEIEDDNSNSNSNMSIYVNTPAVAASAHAPSSQVVTHRPSLLAQLTQPSYRLNIPASHGISQPPLYLSTGSSSQLPSPSQPSQRIAGSSPQYVVTSPSGPAHVRFQSPYQPPSSQPAAYFHH